MLLHITLIIIVLTQFTPQNVAGQNDTTIETTKSSLKTSLADKMKKYIVAILARNKTAKTGNLTNYNMTGNKSVIVPPSRLLYEYLRCRQFSFVNSLPTQDHCPYSFDEENGICWKPTLNGSYAWVTIEYDHGSNQLYDSIRSGIENCTLQRFCLNNGSWTPAVSSHIQCSTCIGDGRPVTFNSISIRIETISLSLSLISLTIAILCMINVKRLHLPRNLLHMHLFLAFILRSIVKLVFIHLIIGGYTSTMINYTRDKCGNIEILSKSSNLFHIVGCRILASLFWYTDAVSQTFIFCEAMFLFTALTSHLFRDRGCTLFVLWGWLSPLVWLSMWIASHIITDKIKRRSTCWLEADNTTYFYYFFYVPYAFYLLINFGIFIFLVRLLYSKYRSNYVPNNRTGNRHLMKSIIILIPLFGLHSLFVMWVFYHQDQGHTIWYFIAVIFKAIFGDLQGFFTSLIYFYFNTEIRSEVLRQVQRTLLSDDGVRRSSTGETISTRLSVFRRSLTRRRRSSNQNRNDKPRTTRAVPSSPPLSARQICWQKFLAFICPCFYSRKNNNNNRNINKTMEQVNELQKRSSIEPMLRRDQILPVVQSNPLADDDMEGVTSNLMVQKSTHGGTVDNDGLTCDTVLMKNDTHELVNDDNNPTIHQTSFSAERIPNLSSSQSSSIHNNANNYRLRSKSDGHYLKRLLAKSSDDDNKSLR